MNALKELFTKQTIAHQKAEIDRLRAELKEREGEIATMSAHIKHLTDLAASRQEEIERLRRWGKNALNNLNIIEQSTAKRVAGEIWEVISSDAPTRLATVGDLNAAAEYEKKLVAVCKKYGVTE